MYIYIGSKYKIYLNSLWKRQGKHING